MEKLQPQWKPQIKLYVYIYIYCGPLKSKADCIAYTCGWDPHPALAVFSSSPAGFCSSLLLPSDLPAHCSISREVCCICIYDGHTMQPEDHSKCCQAAGQSGRLPPCTACLFDQHLDESCCSAPWSIYSFLSYAANIMPQWSIMYLFLISYAGTLVLHGRFIYY